MSRKAKKNPATPPSQRASREREPPHPTLRVRRLHELLAFQNDADAPPGRCPHCQGKETGKDRVIVCVKWFRYFIDYHYCLPCNAILHIRPMQALMRHEDDEATPSISPVPAA